MAINDTPVLPIQRLQGVIGPNPVWQLGTDGLGKYLYYAEAVGNHDELGPVGNWQRRSTQITMTLDVLASTNPEGRGGKAPNEPLRLSFLDAFVTIPSLLLGYSNKHTNAVTQAVTLDRKLPMRCPYAPWLWADSVTNVKGIKFTGKQVGAMGGRFADPPFVVPVNRFPQLPGYISTFERVRMNVTFMTRPYPLWNDRDLENFYDGQEEYRFVEKRPRPTAEYIQVDRGWFVYTDGAVGHPKADATGNPRVPLGFGLITTKVDLEWTWHDVPETYLFKDTGLFPAHKPNRPQALFDAGIPINVYAGIGCVNVAAIWGYPAQTLLCLPPTLTPVEQPVDPGLLGLPNNEQPRAWNVTFRFKYWDPPLGAGATLHGHNVALWPEHAAFYAISSLNGTRPYRTYDFHKFFQPAA